MIDARGPIPRRARVPLHVAVIGEEITERVEGRIKMIAQAVGDHLKAFSIRRNLAREGLRLRVGKLRTLARARHDLIIRKRPRAACVLDRRLRGAIATRDVETLSVRRERDAVIAMLALAFDLAQQRLLIELARALRVAQSIQARDIRLLIHQCVKTVEGIQQTMRAIDLGAEFFHLRLVTAAHRRRRDAEEAAVLIRGEQTTAIIDREAHPGAFALFRDLVQHLHLEARQRFDVLRFGHIARSRNRAATCLRGLTRFCAIKDFTPGFRSIVGDDLRRLPFFCARCRCGPRGIGQNSALAAIRHLHCQRCDESRCAAFVRGLDRQFILPSSQRFRYIRLRGPLPIRIGQHEFAIEKNLRSIVASHAEHGLLHCRITEIELLLQPRGALRVRRIAPEPFPSSHRRLWRSCCR